MIATLTAEAQVTPTPANSVLPVAEVAFNEWAASNGEPYRDVQMVEESNDGFFATVRVLAWFRPAADASWEERETAIECRQVGGVWRCDRNLRAALSAGEVGRRSATATAVAVPTATAVAIAQATAQAHAATVERLRSEHAETLATLRAESEARIADLEGQNQRETARAVAAEAEREVNRKGNETGRRTGRGPVGGVGEG